MSKRSVYIIVAISLLLLIPSTYVVTYCFVSEKMVRFSEPIEREIMTIVSIFKNRKLICQIEINSKKQEDLLSPKQIIKLDRHILEKCRNFRSKCFNNNSTSGYINGVIKFKNIYTKNIECLRFAISEIEHHIREIQYDSRELFCYIHHSYFENINFNEEEIKGIVNANGDDSSYYTKLLHERMEEVYGINLDLEKTKAQKNLDHHIAKLEEYLHAIRAARLAHEPHRPMIRFIGWSLLIFESVGMVLFLCVVYVEVKAWRKGKATRQE